MKTSLDNTADAMQRAHVLASSGDLAGAARLCREIVARSPSHFYALFMLGTLECSLGQFDDAEKHLARAVRLEPRSAEALTSYGNILLELKRYKAAIAALSDAIRLQPQNLNALIYRGLGLAETGRTEEALKDFDIVLRHDPHSVFALHNRANALIALNRHKEAWPSIQTLLRVAPNYGPALMNYALLLSNDKKHVEAIAALDRALAADPNNPELWNARGHSLLSLKRYDDALVCYDKAATILPASASYQLSRGNLFAARGQHGQALAAYERAVALDPARPEGHLNCANMLMEQNRLDEAQTACKRAIAVQADYAPALLLRANLLLHLGRKEEAFAAYDAAIAAKPDYAEAHYHRGSALLINGLFKEGWRDFEYRWNVADCGFDRPVLNAPVWRGEDVAGKSVIVYSEQGLGDAIQFSRFLPRLAEKGAKLTFLCHPNLVRLFSSFAPLMEITAFSDSGRRFDFQSALMSLPERFGIALENLPGSVPYLFAEDALAASWRERIGERGSRIGICWQGNPLGQIDKGRSVPLTKYAPLSVVPGVRLISLQKTHGLDQLASLPAGMQVENLGAFDEGKDAFIDTAAIMQNLDLVITSDTATAHLAGALGRPCWVALKHMPDWRWMLERSDSPWYPTMRLFRQATPGDWGSVFASMADALRNLVQAEPAT